MRCDTATGPSRKLGTNHAQSAPKPFCDLNRATLQHQTKCGLERQTQPPQNLTAEGADVPVIPALSSASQIRSFVHVCSAVIGL